MAVNLVRFFVILFSFTGIELRLFTDIHFWICLGLALITLYLTYYGKKLLSSIFLIISILFSISFLKGAVAAFSVAILLSMMGQSKRFSNKWIMLSIYVLAVSFMHNVFTPLFVLAYIILTFSEDFTAKNGKTRFLVIAALVIFLFAPLPDAHLDMESLTHGVDSSTKLESPQSSTEGLSSIPKSTLSNQGAEEGTKISQTDYNKRQSMIQSLDYFVKGDYILGLIIGLVFITYMFISVVNTSDEKQRRKVIRTLLLSVVVVSVFFIVLPAILNTISGKVGSVSSAEMMGKNELSDSQMVDERSSSIQGPQGDGLEDNGLKKTNGPDTLMILLIFKIVTAISGSIVLFLLIKSYISTLINAGKGQDDGEGADDKRTEGVRYKTVYAYDEIIKMHGAEFVHHAYHYVRQVLYPNLDHLTPYELSSKFEFPELKRLTNNYVAIEYELKEDIEEQELENLRRDFITIIKNSESSIENSQEFFGTDLRYESK